MVSEWFLLTSEEYIGIGIGLLLINLFPPTEVVGGDGPQAPFKKLLLSLDESTKIGGLPLPILATTPEMGVGGDHPLKGGASNSYHHLIRMLGLSKFSSAPPHLFI